MCLPSSCGEFNLGSITPRVMENISTLVEEPLQNCPAFENRGHFAPEWNLARHRVEELAIGPKWTQIESGAKKPKALAS